jgi:hypothetical protein
MAPAAQILASPRAKGHGRLRGQTRDEATAELGVLVVETRRARLVGDRKDLPGPSSQRHRYTKLGERIGVDRGHGRMIATREDEIVRRLVESELRKPLGDARSPEIGWLGSGSRAAQASSWHREIDYGLVHEICRRLEVPPSTGSR